MATNWSPLQKKLIFSSAIIITGFLDWASLTSIQGNFIIHRDQDSRNYSRPGRVKSRLERPDSCVIFCLIYKCSEQEYYLISLKRKIATIQVNSSLYVHNRWNKFFTVKNKKIKSDTTPRRKNEEKLVTRILRCSLRQISERVRSPYERDWRRNNGGGQNFCYLIKCANTKIACEENVTKQARSLQFARIILLFILPSK